MALSKHVKSDRLNIVTTDITSSEVRKNIEGEDGSQLELAVSCGLDV